MSTTAKQDSEFLVDVVGTGLLESAIDWIAANLDPTAVFPEKDLLNWASSYDPQDVFDKQNLEYWAESNGYTKE
jgi:hypothetical protein